ncbi:hypothetical protein COT99_00650, partial [Candidatus Falkowbacteria bacterium CG10_big_fil_rev_8_21_14_0_10_43_10]
MASLTKTNSQPSHPKIIIAVIFGMIVILLLAVSFMALVLTKIPAPKGGNGSTLLKFHGQSDIIITPITNRDHRRGSLSAPITIVEFVDLECPASKEFHPVMK